MMMKITMLKMTLIMKIIKSLFIYEDATDTDDDKDTDIDGDEDAVH